MTERTKPCPTCGACLTGMRKLNEEQVVQILLAEPRDIERVRKQLGFSRASMYELIRGLSYRSVRKDIPRGARTKLSLSDRMTLDAVRAEYKRLEKQSDE